MFVGFPSNIICNHFQRFLLVLFARSFRSFFSLVLFARSFRSFFSLVLFARSFRSFSFFSLVLYSLDFHSNILCNRLPRTYLLLSFFLSIIRLIFVGIIVASICRCCVYFSHTYPVVSIPSNVSTSFIYLLDLLKLP